MASSSPPSKREADGTKERSPNAKKGDDRSVFGSVGDEILGDILFRLPRESLLSSRLVSTRWFSVTSDPSFVRSYQSLRHPMLGFFYQWSREDPPMFVTTARSPNLKESAHRIGSILDFLPNEGHLSLVDSCGGLLLLDDHTEDCYFVCNSLTKEWVEIPYPPSEIRGLIGLTCSEENPSSFQVVQLVEPEQLQLLDVVPEMGYYEIEVETFSSDTQTWKVSRPMYPYSFLWARPNSIRIQNPEIETLPVFVGGVLYWLNGEFLILAYNEKRPDCVLVEEELPEGMTISPYNTGCLGKAEGQLCYAKVSTTHLSVWVLTGDYPILKWTLKHRIEWGPRLCSEIQQYETRHSRWLMLVGGDESEDPYERNKESSIAYVVRPIGFHCNDSNIMFLSMQNRVYSYHLRTRELQDLYCDAFEAVPLIFPYEMLEFPITLLGSTAEKGTSDH